MEMMDGLSMFYSTRCFDHNISSYGVKLLSLSTTFVVSTISAGEKKKEKAWEFCFIWYPLQFVCIPAYLVVHFILFLLVL